jgi:O-antigen/teichoic acid export membrane protein
MRQELARLSKNTLIYGVGGLANRFIGMLFLPVFTAYLSPADYGISAILSLVTFVAISVFSLGLGTGIGPCYFEGNRPEQKERTIWTAFLLLAGSAGILAAGGTLVAVPLSSVALGVKAHGHLVVLAILAGALNILQIPLTLRLQFEERAWLFALLGIASSLVATGSSLLLVVYFRRGVLGLMEAGVIWQALSLLLYLLPTLPRLAFRPSRSLAGELLRLGLPMVPSFAFLFVLQQANKYLLQWQRGIAEVGIYSLGFNFGLVMNLLVLAFQTAWYPYFMSFVDRQDEARVLFGRIVTYYVFGVGSLTLLFFLAARPAVMLLVQPPFREAYLAVGLSAACQFFIGIFGLLLPGIYYAREVRYLSLIQGIAACASIGLNLLLIPVAGMLGAAIALAAGALILAALQHAWNRYRRYLDIHFEWSRLGSFAVVFVLYVVLTLWNPGWTPLGLALFLGILACLLPAWLYLLLSPEERRALRGLCQAWTAGLAFRRSPGPYGPMPDNRRE